MTAVLPSEHAQTPVTFSGHPGMREASGRDLNKGEPRGRQAISELQFRSYAPRADSRLRC